MAKMVTCQRMKKKMKKKTRWLMRASLSWAARRMHMARVGLPMQDLGARSRVSSNGCAGRPYLTRSSASSSILAPQPFLLHVETPIT